MGDNYKKDGKFSYLESGEGRPIIILHGLMGNLSNFDGVFDHFSSKGYQVLMPELPIYSMPLINTNVKNLAKFIREFTQFKKLEDYILLGNSLGGHIALYYAKHYPDSVAGIVLTGSSGLYENSMGESYPKRGDYEYIKKKTQDVFFNPEIATKEIIDDVYASINDRHKLIRTLSIAKSAIRHNMSNDLPTMEMPAGLIWGKNDTVTPPEVAKEFHKLLPNSSLYWIEKCGHAPMMEHPDSFNHYLEDWLIKEKL